MLHSATLKVTEPTSENSSSRDCLENSLRVLDLLCLLASRERDETFSPCFGYSLHSQSRPIGTFQTVSPRNRVNRDSNKAHRISLSLLVSNLSSTRSKASVPMRAPPEKGCSMAPMVNSTSPITVARVSTISL